MMKKILFTINLVVISLIAKSQVTIYSNRENPKTDLEVTIEQYTNKVDSIVISEKKKMKTEIDDINKLLKDKIITEEQAEKFKKEISEKYASSIDEKVEAYSIELDDIIAKRVAISVKNSNSMDLDSTLSKAKKFKNNNSRFYIETRFALSKVGLNEEGSGFNMDNPNFSFSKSGVTELSFIINTKLGKNLKNTPWSMNMGLGLLWNTLWLKDNTQYIDEDANGNVVFNTFYTKLEKSKIRGTYLTAPLEIRYDFLRNKVSKKGTNYNDVGFNITAGTYIGYKIISKRILLYNDGGKEKDKTSGDFNQAPVIYGLSVAVQYKSIGLFVRKDLNEYFSNYNSHFNQRIEFGLRLGF